MVVSVVVRERTECAGEENVLPSPPVRPLELTAPPTVTVVPAFESAVAVSELTVSVVVETVGAADFLLIHCGCWSSLETGRDSLLCEGEV